MGQFFTPYEVSRMMAGIILQNAGEIIDRKGFVTLSEPTCGAGGMILAATDVLASQGRDIGQTVYVDATDLSQLCFHMCYVQLSLRGIPAVVRRGNSLSLEMFETARTPALLPFLIRHGDPFKDQSPQDAPTAAEDRSGETILASATSQPPNRPIAPARPTIAQLDLFGD